MPSAKADNPEGLELVFVVRFCCCRLFAPGVFPLFERFLDTEADAQLRLLMLRTGPASEEIARRQH